jgi:C4-dicarboxylate-specific signal transduction histidine kinase
MISKKYMLWLGLLTLLAVVLGGCKDVKGNEQTAIIEEAQKVAITHFQEEYGLEVQITKQEMLPTYVASQVNMEGHVVGEEEQRFNISVNYKDWSTLNTFLSPELNDALNSKKEK